MDKIEDGLPRYQFMWLEPADYSVSDAISWYTNHNYHIMESWIERTPGLKSQVLILWERGSGYSANHLNNLVELLSEWMAMNSRSPLDGTISCKKCWAMIVEQNAEKHKCNVV